MSGLRGGELRGEGTKLPLLVALLLDATAADSAILLGTDHRLPRDSDEDEDTPPYQRTKPCVASAEVV